MAKQLMDTFKTSSPIVLDFYLHIPADASVAFSHLENVLEIEAQEKVEKRAVAGLNVQYTFSFILLPSSIL